MYFSKEKDQMIRSIISNKNINEQKFWSAFNEYDRLMNLFILAIDLQKIELHLAYCDFSNSLGTLDIDKIESKMKDNLFNEIESISEIVDSYKNDAKMDENFLRDEVLKLSTSLGEHNALQNIVIREDFIFSLTQKIGSVEDDIECTFNLNFIDLMDECDSRHKYLFPDTRRDYYLEYVDEKVDSPTADILGFYTFTKDFGDTLLSFALQLDTTKNDTRKKEKTSDARCIELVSEKINRNKKIKFNEFEKIIEKNFQGIVGLSEIKNELLKRVALHCRTTRNTPYNILITGNPGTGKTTAAKIICKVLYECGVIENSKFCGITAADLQGQYVGQTIPKIQNIFNEARGGVIFLDEVYSLATDTAYTNDAVNELLLQLESYENRNTVVIAAGYKDKIDQFFNANPGLKSRFSGQIHLNDYTIDQLLTITCNAIKDQDFNIDSQACSLLKSMYENDIKKENFGNARYAVKIAEQVVANGSVRLWENQDPNNTISTEDVNKYYTQRNSSERNDRKIGF